MPSRRNARSQRDQDLEDLHETILTASNGHEASTPRPSQIDMGELVEALRGVVGQGRGSQFKPPQFQGEGDVELFITQFTDVARANQWEEPDNTLHLRSVLSGKALDCGRGRNMEEIFMELRRTFSLTERQARDRLHSYHKGPRQTWREVGKDLSSLVTKAYSRMSSKDQEEMVLEIFTKNLDRAMQRHFLLRPPDDLQEAVQMVEEYLQIGGDHKPTKLTAVETDQPEQSVTESKVAKEVPNLAMILSQTVATMKQLMEGQTATLAAIQGMAQPAKEKKPISCFACGGPHLKKSCPRLINTPRLSGNESGPAQPRAQLSLDQRS